MFKNCKRIERLERIYRKEIRDRLTKDITIKNEEMIKNGLYPFEGRWLPLDKIKKYRKELKKKNREIFFELIFLLLFIGFIAFESYNVLLWLSS